MECFVMFLYPIDIRWLKIGSIVSEYMNRSRIPSECAYAVSHMRRISALMSGVVDLNWVASDSISTFRFPKT